MCGQTTKYLMKLNVKTAMDIKKVFQTIHVYFMTMKIGSRDFTMK